MNVQTTKIEPDIAVVEISGKLALGRESQRIESVVEELLKNQVRKVVFDMKGVEYIDSSGIGMLAYCAGKMKEVNGSFVISGPGGRVLNLLKMTQIDSIVPIYGNLDEAAAALGNAASA